MEQTRVPTDFIELAEAMAQVSGEILRGYFRQPIEVENKADDSPVTKADREVEDALRAMISKDFPGHGICGEERQDVGLEAEYVWAIDPLDGTSGFITGKPLFGTLIGLIKNGTPVYGLIDHPVTKERWQGGVGHPATFSGPNLKNQSARSRTGKSLDQAMLYATTPHMFEGKQIAAFARLGNQVKQAQYGIDCYAYGLLASGYVDLVAEATMKPCDYCALAPVVEAAGGIITDWSGKPLTLNSDGTVLAAGDKDLHGAALAVLQEDL